MASDQPKPTDSSLAERNDCTHHWLLPDPTGESVTGVCRRCGAKREFPVSMPSGAERPFSLNS